MFKRIWNIIKQVRPTKRFYWNVFGLVLLFILAFSFPALYIPGVALMWLMIMAIFADAFFLMRHKQPIHAWRVPRYKRLSNGDVNTLTLHVQSFYAFKVGVDIVDELPFQVQIRNFKISTQLDPEQERNFNYDLKPTERGEYHFGKINLFIKTKLGFIERHAKVEDPFMMACYPSFIRLRQFELLAISNRLTDIGIKRMRRIGNSSEFEQIKEYVAGDDIRTINWKATARKTQLMVNHYRDERSQHVYSIIDMGRVMKMPFEGLSLLDYAINASLVIGHVAWIKQDKPGVMGFSNHIDFKVKTDNRGDQLLRIQEALYNAKTNFLETSYETLFSHVRQKITQRSLLLLFTNFETVSALRRQMKYLRRIATHHVLVVIFFENTELKDLLNAKPASTFDIYEQTIAQKFDYEKRQISKELQQYGILSVYTTPEKLTINALNKYLEIKTRGLI
jgi:uncharacterized protein (DUF58 family)